jgi:hypothetical protein
MMISPSTGQPAKGDYVLILQESSGHASNQSRGAILLGPLPGDPGAQPAVEVMGGAIDRLAL